MCIECVQRHLSDDTPCALPHPQKIWGYAVPKAEHRFYGYLDKVLCKATIKRMIMAHFHLPLAMTIFQTDLHDTTDPDELDQLFSR